MDRKEEGSRSVDAWEEAAVLIAQEIRDWSERVLEVPTATYGELPPCPFARAAWMREHVMVHVCSSLDAAIEVKACFPPTEELTHVIAVVDWEQYTVEEFNAWIDDQNKSHFGVWMMGFHPEAADDELTPEYEGLGADDYAIVIVQSLEHLVRASDDLRKTGYYHRYPASDLEYINQRRETFYAWDEKVNAKAYREQEERLLQERIANQENEH
jgi:hypothetical protein